MKKRNLILLLILALIMVIPANIKAFSVEVAGNCNNAQGTTATGTAAQLCYVGTTRHITFITSTANQKYFCLQENKLLNEATYSDTAANTYTNSGYACAVYSALRDSNGITIDSLKGAIGNVNEGTLNFNNNTLTVGSNYTVASVTPGSPADVYVKIQQAIWANGMSESTTCTHPYVETVASAPAINSLSATALAQDTATDTYYYSKVTVNKNSSVSSYNVTLTNAPTGTIISSNKTAGGQINGAITAAEFYVLVPATATPLTTQITVKAEATYPRRKVTNAVLTEYTSNDTTNQTLGKLNVRIEEEIALTNATANITNSSINFQICKKDSKTNLAMSGVGFRVTSEDNSVTFDLTTGTDGCATKTNIKKAKYVIHELATPNGYKKGADYTLDCTSKESGTTCKYDALNTPITLKVRKLDDSNEPLKDARMQILDKDGNVFDEWTTVLEDHIVNKNIPFGKYILREEEAPAGYVISTEIAFEIKEDSYIVGGVTKPYGDDAIVTVTMIDKVTKVSILKTNAETGEPLVGATLRIEDADGNPVTDEWVSTAEPQVFTKLPFGTYYLVEVAAPEGYVLQEERIEFTISQSSPESEVVIENHEVPNTASAKSALLISFAMLDIALGIAIILYVRKRKLTE